MKKTTLLKSTVIALPVLLLVSLGGSVAYAAQATGTTESTATSVVAHIPLTDAQKATLKEVKTLRDAGKTTEAHALLTQAGLTQFDRGHGKRGGMMGHGGKGGFGNQAAHTAVENTDFSAWKTAMSGYSNQAVITQELFDKMVQVEKLKKEIHTTLGL